MLHNRRVLAFGDHFFIISKMNKTSCFKSRHFINIYIPVINRTLHGRLGIRILSSRAESISHSFASLTCEILSALEDKIRIPARPCNILYIYRGYYMAARVYEFYLLVLKVSLTPSLRSLVRYFQHSKIKFVYPRGHVISSIYI